VTFKKALVLFGLFVISVPQVKHAKTLEVEVCLQKFSPWLALKNNKVCNWSGTQPLTWAWQTLAGAVFCIPMEML